MSSRSVVQHQNPELTASILDNHNQYKFTLKNIHTSTANALRRTILSDIPVYCIRTESAEYNQCKIGVNSTRFHNEILKQRLSCIPIHFPVEKTKVSSVEKWRKEMEKTETNPIVTEDGYDLLRYELEVDVKNEKDHEMVWVTTENFQLKDSNTGIYLEREEVRKIFPPSEKTQRYIDFVRLRPPIGSTIPGEAIKLSANFSVASARTNGMFNVASICTFSNTIDIVKREKHLDAYRKELDARDDMPTEMKRFELENFNQLQTQRYFVANSNGDPIQFDFIVQSIGIYEPTDIVQMGCTIIEDKLSLVAQMADAQELPIIPSDRIRESGLYSSVTESSIPNCFDIVLMNEDYTIGNVLERILYDMYYQDNQIMNYVGFKKYHPHDSYSIIRVAYHEEQPLLSIYKHIIEAAKHAKVIFEKIRMKIV